jgi:hypothetical protein
MRAFAPLLFLAVLSCGRTDPGHVSAAEFQREYASVGQAQTVRDVAYLGQRGGRAYLRVKSMSTIGKEWSERTVFVELSELDEAFRASLPTTEYRE